MKQVVIDNKMGVVEVDGKSIPRLLLDIIRGAVGKCFVVKHYKKGRKKSRKVVVTRYPDMSGIVASEKQRVRRDLFREAVVYAKWIVADGERKRAFRNTLPWKRRKHVYQAAIRLYLNMQGDAGWLRKQLAVKAMVRDTKHETSNLNWNDQQGPWLRIWQKRDVKRNFSSMIMDMSMIIDMRSFVLKL